MEFVEGKKYFMEGVEILKLGKHAIEKVAKDEKASLYAVLFFAIAGIAQAIGTFKFFGIITYPIVMLIVSFIGVGIFHLLALLFGGKGEFMHLYRPLGIGNIVSWVAVIPFISKYIGGIAGLWSLVVSVVVIKTVHKLSTGKAIAVVLIPILVVAAIAAVFVVIGAAFLAGSFLNGVPAYPGI